ncbi:hypothetical protein KSP39_PZI003984 [Platanthera zijinensis]|uniref:Ubiquitin-like protease family profile domain-containing protein n=1 Tax=Platanthera zijinensis TaxID=2320716 RepID=A0AAP0BUU1_9ASPA
MPSLPQNIPLLYVLVRAYNRHKQAFLLGKKYCKFTVNEVAMILGLPNHGQNFTFVRLPCIDISYKDLTEDLNALAWEDWSPTLESRRLDSLILYLVNVFFFPLKGMKVPASLYKIRGFSNFQKYNWPKAIHEFLLSQIDTLSQSSVIKKVPGLPQQANGDDCGVYVLKYMEALASTDNISWEECSNWSSQTVKFRAELAAEMITTFAKKSSH